MEVEDIRRNWNALCEDFLRNPRKGLRRLSAILGRSQRFLSMLSAGGVSSAYSSYADTLRNSVERVFQALLQCVDDAESHSSIYFILANYRNAQNQEIAPIVQEFLRGGSPFLLQIMRRICSEEKMRSKFSEEETLQILKKAAEGAESADFSAGEGNVRIIFALYRESFARENKQIFLSEMMKSFQMRYIDFFVSKVFPEMAAQESPGFIASLVGILAKIPEIPILTISQHIPRNALLGLPPALKGVLVERIQRIQPPQEHVGGAWMAAKVPEVVDVNVLFQALIAHESVDITYAQGEAVVEYAITSAEAGIVIRPRERFSEEKDGEKEMLLDVQEASAFLERLFLSTDGTRIQLCRILFHIRIPSQKGKLTELLGRKNIRVKWNALRALTAYALDAEEVSLVQSLLSSTRNEKIKLWCLKILEVTGGKFDLSGLQVEDTPYRQEIERLRERINN
ncbi:uncharacterized protein NEMAJ01_2228 [Nematocida major]|uniref:uncharacterized protein n=1 Tax=Nematocida major TaxID=1912982 RepID=UPI0020084A8A|nr:uncharacterized protein NEMAJ01_2228 [Nematocida major]KAH9387332.1 hypothetical protein NEMAJ01_2228 [Nematocida major]